MPPIRKMCPWNCMRQSTRLFWRQVWCLAMALTAVKCIRFLSRCVSGRFPSNQKAKASTTARANGSPHKHNHNGTNHTHITYNIQQQSHPKHINNNPPNTTHACCYPLTTICVCTGLVYFMESRVKVQGPELAVKAEWEIVHFMDNQVVVMPPHGGAYPTINLSPAGVRTLQSVLLD